MKILISVIFFAKKSQNGSFVYHFRSGAYEISASQAVFPEKVAVIQREVSAEPLVVDKA